MTDLVTRLRTWVHAVHAVPVSDLMDEAAAEIERLRNGAVGNRETVQLTDAELEAISRELSWLQWCVDNNQIGDVGRMDIATLRGLLERLK